MNRRSGALFCLLCILWGGNWIAARSGVERVPAILFTALRSILAGLAVLWCRCGVIGLLVLTSASGQNSGHNALAVFLVGAAIMVVSSVTVMTQRSTVRWRRPGWAIATS